MRPAAESPTLPVVGLSSFSGRRNGGSLTALPDRRGLLTTSALGDGAWWRGVHVSGAAVGDYWVVTPQFA